MHLTPRTIRGTHNPSELTVTIARANIYHAARACTCETIDLPSKPFRREQRYTENTLVEDRADARREIYRVEHYISDYIGGC